MTEAASENTSSTTAGRDTRGRFQPGCSGNPAGKRPGTLNRATTLKRVMEEGDDERIASLIVERALKGEWGALRFVQDRLEPKPRARPIMLDFPEGATVAEMAEIVLCATAAGEISPEEALQMMRLLGLVEDQRRTAWAAATVQGHPVPATRPTVARRPAGPPAAAPAPDLHSASIATPLPCDATPVEPAASLRRRRRAARAAVASALGAPPELAAMVAGAAGPTDRLYSTCNLQL